MSETPEMVERVAKAIEALGSVDVANYRDRHAIARAAIEAMRDMTDEMAMAFRVDEIAKGNASVGNEWANAIDAALATPAPERMR
jgi:hypothetical protein